MKKATTVDEQITELTARGLNIDLKQDVVKKYFEEIGYYSLGFFN